MKRVWLTIVAFILAFQAYAAAPPAPLTPDCRYLFIVDTSLSMSRLQEGVNNSVYRMVTSGLNGQIIPGEVFTIWTFNEEVQQREFPLNSWTTELNQSMGNRVLQHLQTQRYRRNANMRALINAIYQAKQTCPRLAVFLISNGQEVLVGTPFDRNINVSYGRRFEELRGARVPFLTTLLCKNGNFVGWSVNAANEPITLPRGPDGEFVVGREKQQTAGIPPAVVTVPTIQTNAPPVITPTPTVVPSKSAASMTVKPRTKSIASVVPKPIPVKPVPPPQKRNTINLSPEPKKVAKASPRVVKPTDVAPDNRVKLTSASFTKTNQTLKGKTLTNPQETTITNTAAIKKPATNAVTAKVAEAPPAVKPVKVVKPEPKKTTAKTPPIVKAIETPKPKPAPAKQVAKSKPVAKAMAPEIKVAKPKPATKPFMTTDVIASGTNEPKVITRWITITQVVNVAMPTFKERPKAAPQKVEGSGDTVVEAAGESRPEPKKVEPKKVEPQKVEPKKVEPKIATAMTEAPAKQVASFVAGPDSAASDTNALVAAPSPSPNKPAPAALGVVDGGKDLTRWILLAVGVLLVILAVLTAIRLLDRPVGATYISQSMGSRDNGSRPAN